MDERELRAMKLHEVYKPDRVGHLFEIVRVVGGWVYLFKYGNGFSQPDIISTVFVPE